MSDGTENPSPPGDIVIHCAGKLTRSEFECQVNFDDSDFHGRGPQTCAVSPYEIGRHQPRDSFLDRRAGVFSQRAFTGSLSTFEIFPNLNAG